MRIVIVGAGAIGLSCAYYAARAGAEVVVLDKSHPGAGASSHNAGWVVPSMSEPVPSPAALRRGLRWALLPDSPLHVRASVDPRFIGFMARMVRNCSTERFLRGLQATARLNSGTRNAFDDLERDGLAFEHHRTGVLQAFLHDEEISAHLCDLTLMEEYGSPPARELNAAEVRALEPALSSNVQGGILCPGERFLDPAAFIVALVRRCLELGVEFHDGVSVSGIETEGSRAIAVRSDRAWRADKFVLAAGVWTREVARSTGLRLPLQAGKGYGFDFSPPPVSIRHAIYLSERKVAVTPLNNSVRLAGTMEFGGRNSKSSGSRAHALIRAAGEYFVDWPTDRAPRPWVGLRPMTPDGLPLLGVLSRMDNVAIAAGHAMLGITLAPVSGQLITEALITGKQPPELRAFSPERFRLVGRR